MSHWWKIEVLHGPGHQGKTIEYFYCTDDDLDEEYLEWAVERMMRGCCPSPLVARHERVWALPEDVWQKKVEEYQRQKAHAEEMLKVLEG